MRIMHMKRALIVGSVATLALSSISATATDSESPRLASGTAERASELLAPFKKDLMAALAAGMAGGGPAAAIDACRIEAPAIAERRSRDGVRMGRSSHRLRNPANAGPRWVTAIIDDYLSHPELLGPRVVELDDGRAGYVEPIRLQAMCLVCHGETIEPGLAQTFEERYPDDRATGFAVGDLRGVFWVELPAD